MSNKDILIYALFAVIVVSLILLFTKNQKVVNTNNELQEKIQVLDNTVFSLKKDIVTIREEKGVVKNKIASTKSKIQVNENKKISIINKPYTDVESIRIITEHFKKNNIPTTYSN